MQKIKILTITTTGLIRKEGISTILLDYFSKFDKSEFKIDLVSFGIYSEELVKEFEDNSISVKFLPHRKKEMFKYMIELGKLIKKEKYEIIYLNGSSALLAIELLVAWLCGCKVRIVHSHNTKCDFKKADKLLRPLFYRLYTHAFSCGQKAGEWLFENKPFTIIKNGRDCAKYKYNVEKRTLMREKFGIDESTFIVGHVGCFNDQKNQTYLVKIFNKLLEFNDNSKLVLVGDGSKIDEVKQLVKDLELEEKVLFLGNVNNVDEVLQMMDVMCLPSLYEGLPLVVVEWQISALPSVISNTVTTECAYTDIVKYMSLNDDEEKWARAIIEMSKVDRKAIMDDVIELTRINGFDINDNAENLQSLLKELVNERR